VKDWGECRAESLERTHCIAFMDILSRQFGLVIAYLLPGFIALIGVAPFVPMIAGWLRADQSGGFGAPVYALLAATAAGMIVSCFRWVLVDQVLLMTGMERPTFNARALEQNPSAFNYLIENHYRYFQFYANTLVAVVWTYFIYRSHSTSSHLTLGTDAGVMVLCAVLFAGSRDALGKFRMRSQLLVRQVPNNFWNGELMTNGIDRNAGGGNSSDKPQAPAKLKKTKAEVLPKQQSSQASQKQSKH